MSESVKKIATRESYGAALVELAEKHSNVIALDADVAGATKTAMLAKKFPERHINCGIAESNMVGVAAGLSTTGIVPFVSSFAMFLAGRAFDQVRNSIGYPHLNVKLCATHGGISVGEDGASHQCCEDFALMRSIPGMVVICPSDDIEARAAVHAVYEYEGPVYVRFASHQCCEDFALMRSIPGMVVICPSDDIEARAAVHAVYEYEGPVYVRFGRLAVPVINDESLKFTIGKGTVLRAGTDIAIIANGLTVARALEAADKLAEQGIRCRVINMATIKPLDTELVVKAAKDCGKIITVEEHNIIGGLGEAVAAAVAENHPVPVYRIGVMDTFGHSGPAEKLLVEFGLTADKIIEKVNTVLGK